MPFFQWALVAVYRKRACFPPKTDFHFARRDNFGFAGMRCTSGYFWCQVRMIVSWGGLADYSLEAIIVARSVVRYPIEAGITNMRVQCKSGAVRQ